MPVRWRSTYTLRPFPLCPQSCQQRHTAVSLRTDALHTHTLTHVHTHTCLQRHLVGRHDCGRYHVHHLGQVAQRRDGAIDSLLSCQSSIHLHEQHACSNEHAGRNGRRCKRRPSHTVPMSTITSAFASARRLCSGSIQCSRDSSTGTRTRTLRRVCMLLTVMTTIPVPADAERDRSAWLAQTCHTRCTAQGARCSTPEVYSSPSSATARHAVCSASSYRRKTCASSHAASKVEQDARVCVANGAPQTGASDCSVPPAPPAPPTHASAAQTPASTAGPLAPEWRW